MSGDSGHDIGEAGSQVRDRDRGACESRRALYDEAMGIVFRGISAGFPAEALFKEGDIGTHFTESLGISEPFFIDSLMDDGGAGSLSHQDDEGLLPVGHEAGMDVGFEV